MCGSDGSLGKSMTKKRIEKKTDMIEVRMPHSKKEAFKAACEAEGITVSHAVRSFVDAYLKRSRRMKIQRITKDVSMTLIRNPIKTTSSLGAVLAATITAIAFSATPSAAENYVEPLNLTTVEYPTDLPLQGISALCEAKFDIASSGRVEGAVDVDCTHDGFDQSVRAAVYTLEYDQKIVDGKAVEQLDVVYPFEFEIVTLDGPVDDFAEPNLTGPIEAE
jgi:hypothetical protein